MLRSRLLSALAIFQVSFLRPAQALHPPFGGPPANATDLKIIRSPQGAEIRFKEPGICETTPGVKSYSGYISLNETTNMFFWFFERRKDPHNAPFTLWLAGGPGADSISSIFLGNGPCDISADLTAEHNPHSWNEVSNMLYLSQPIGVGFSYASAEEGCFNKTSKEWDYCTEPNGRYYQVDPYAYPTSYAAAECTWHILQAFMTNLPQLDPALSNKDVDFHLWTASVSFQGLLFGRVHVLTTSQYGGHYGPAFFDYFYEHNLAISNGTENGTQMNMGTLGILGGSIDAKIQMPYYNIFASNNTYGIKVNDSVYTMMEFIYNMPNGCRNALNLCALHDHSTFSGKVACAHATFSCYGLIGALRTALSRSEFDIRLPPQNSSTQSYYDDFLNLAETQAALGVSINYTSPFSKNVYMGFLFYGDVAYPTFKTDLEDLLQKGVRVALFYGDADYVANWMGGEAVSLALDFEGQKEFRGAGYAPLVVGGKEYGVVRQYENFSFAKIYECGHGIPYDQPKASLEFFRRTLEGLSVSDGLVRVGKSYKTNGTAKATRTESYVPLATE